MFHHLWGPIWASRSLAKIKTFDRALCFPGTCQDQIDLNCVSLSGLAKGKCWKRCRIPNFRAVEHMVLRPTSKLYIHSTCGDRRKVIGKHRKCRSSPSALKRRPVSLCLQSASTARSNGRCSGDLWCCLVGFGPRKMARLLLFLMSWWSWLVWAWYVHSGLALYNFLIVHVC